MRAILLALFMAVTGCLTITSNEPTDLVKPDLTEGSKQQWNLMIGSWYGKQPSKNGGHSEWIVNRYADGTYNIKFKFADSSQSEEVGEWGISGGIYFSIFKGWLKKSQFRPADPADPYNRDAYDILSLTEDAFSYRHRETGDVYRVIKVANDFRFTPSTDDK
ncbi:hypothetical protein [Veronia pacifica]|uniref:Lipoprotein n=1 Tax=Veronia pacifica TaxID=1080227 RepID=A0A1C3EMN1_9GAMM|nr:hypothetical protein [Veronia pacifica]ODA34490.1 hypothetical protein A8L45_05835 [Veronia pacifica]